MSISQSEVTSRLWSEEYVRNLKETDSAALYNNVGGSTKGSVMMTRVTYSFVVVSLFLLIPFRETSANSCTCGPSKWACDPELSKIVNMRKDCSAEKIGDRIRYYCDWSRDQYCPYGCKKKYSLPKYILAKDIDQKAPLAKIFCRTIEEKKRNESGCGCSQKSSGQHLPIPLLLTLTFLLFQKTVRKKEHS